MNAPEAKLAAYVRVHGIDRLVSCNGSRVHGLVIKSRRTGIYGFCGGRGCDRLRAEAHRARWSYRVPIEEVETALPGGK